MRTVTLDTPKRVTVVELHLQESASAVASSITVRAEGHATQSRIEALDNDTEFTIRVGIQLYTIAVRRTIEGP